MSLQQVGFEFLFHPVSTSTADNTFNCVRCNHRGCDVKVHGCECSFHATCIKIARNEKIQSCPHCKRPTSGLILSPMSFIEVDEARKFASISKLSSKPERKRKRPAIFKSESNDDNESIASSETPTIRNDDKEYQEFSTCNYRTGRWTDEEIKFCDGLISLFKQGQLPLAKGVKLNDFLSSMLKSKQTRLTKKMKNAKLSSVTFTPSSPYIENDSECLAFSKLEDNFFKAIQDPGERAELKFHVRHEWRGMFRNFCVQTGKKLDTDAWLTSVDERDRRNSIARDAYRMKRRRDMMANAIAHDSSNVEAGVFIERNETDVAAMRANDLSKASCDPLLMGGIQMEGTNHSTCIPDDITLEVNGKSITHSSPFLHEVSTYMKSRSIPFEQAEIWAPSLFQCNELNSESNCRLSFAGNTIMDSVIPASKIGPPEVMSTELKFNLLSFGDYSQKFSYETGCGLPGRVYRTGVSEWKQNIQTASSTPFERCGGAIEWGIKTVVGIPIPSLNVGRIVIVLYSVHNREKCERTLLKLQNEFTKLAPIPKWKIVVDVSHSPAFEYSQSSVTTTQTTTATSTSVTTNSSAIENLINLLANEMPSIPKPSLYAQTQSLVSLRLFLLRQRRDTQENDIVKTILASYASYIKSGQCNSEIAVMLAHEFTFLTQTQSTQTQPPINMNFQQLSAAQYSSAGTLPEQFYDKTVNVQLVD